MDSNICHHAVFFFKPSILVVDDNEDFFSIIGFHLDEGCRVRFGTNPIKVIETIKAEFFRAELIKDYFQHLTLLSEEDTAFQLVNIGFIDAINAVDFSRKISVVLADQEMPMMSGDAMLREIKKIDPKVKTVMITAGASYEEGIDFVNENLIDRFMTKKSAKLPMINDYINELQWEFVSDLCGRYYESLPLWTKSVLKSTAFKVQFKKLIKEDTYTSYFLVDTEGSFYVRDNVLGGCWVFCARLSEQIRLITALSIEDDDFQEIGVTKEEVLLGEVIIKYVSDGLRAFPASVINIEDEVFLMSELVTV